MVATVTAIGAWRKRDGQAETERRERMSEKWKKGEIQTLNKPFFYRGGKDTDASASLSGYY